MAIEPGFQIGELDQPARPELQARQLAVCDGFIEPRPANPREASSFGWRNCQRAIGPLCLLHCSEPVGAGRAPANTTSTSRAPNKIANKIVFDLILFRP